MAKSYCQSISYLCIQWSDEPCRITCGKPSWKYSTCLIVRKFSVRFNSTNWGIRKRSNSDFHSLCRRQQMNAKVHSKAESWKAECRFLDTYFSYFGVPTVLHRCIALNLSEFSFQRNLSKIWWSLLNFQISTYRVLVNASDLLLFFPPHTEWNRTRFLDP